MFEDSLELIFWIANVAASPLWVMAVVAPKWSLTERVWNQRWLPLPFALGFFVLVLPRIVWWLSLFNPSSMTIQSLVDAFATRDSFLILWLYILGFDVAVFAWMYQEARRKDYSTLALSVLALITMYCAPGGLAIFIIMDSLFPSKGQAAKEGAAKKDQ